MHAPAFFVFMFRKECSEDDSGCAVMQQQGVEQGEEKDLKKHYSLFALQVDSEAQAGGATRANRPSSPPPVSRGPHSPTDGFGRKTSGGGAASERMIDAMTASTAGITYVTASSPPVPPCLSARACAKHTHTQTHTHNIHTHAHTTQSYVRCSLAR